MLHEPTARADEVLCLNVEDLPPQDKRGKITSDTHGAGEIVFGLFHLMGRQFSPRLADAGSAALHRTGLDADCGPLSPVTCDKINFKQIAIYWDELLRLAGSLYSGTIKASEALRILAPAASPPRPPSPERPSPRSRGHPRRLVLARTLGEPAADLLVRQAHLAADLPQPSALAEAIPSPRPHPSPRPAPHATGRPAAARSPGPAHPDQRRTAPRPPSVSRASGRRSPAP
ncbi:hypothetical protein GCM10009549_52790 [Streptomyces thermoalcalitolerans]|uniref:Tn3 transposase DDE domain-containing protein n=2 Tax=Streptomyces thermoalcalitolerans TaxID=65605 RepID=A0ABN1PKT2_9ACTN